MGWPPSSQRFTPVVMAMIPHAFGRIVSPLAGSCHPPTAICQGDSMSQIRSLGVLLWGFFPTAALLSPFAQFYRQDHKAANRQAPKLMEKMVCESEASMKRMFVFLIPDISESCFTLTIIYEPVHSPHFSKVASSWYYLQATSPDNMSPSLSIPQKPCVYDAACPFISDILLPHSSIPLFHPFVS